MASMGLAELPTFYTLGPEADGGRTSVANQGVMLMRLESMRATYWRFVESTFSPKHIAAGLHFGGYGPADQGAYNKFYAGLFFVQPWSRFNWKPYWPYNPEATIMHWHGPKPDDYKSLRATANISNPLFAGLLGRCDFTDAANGCVPWMDEWEQMVNRYQARGTTRGTAVDAFRESMDQFPEQWRPWMFDPMPNGLDSSAGLAMVPLEFRRPTGSGVGRWVAMQETMQTRLAAQESAVARRTIAAIVIVLLLGAGLRLRWKSE